MSNVYSQVGKKIRYYRKAIQYTQEELGHILKIDQSYLGRIERGEINITLETLYKISEALQVTPSQLLDSTREIPDKSKHESLEKIDILLSSLNSVELKIIYRMLKEVIELKNV